MPDQAAMHSPRLYMIYTDTVFGCERFAESFCVHYYVSPRDLQPCGWLPVGAWPTSRANNVSATYLNLIMIAFACPGGIVNTQQPAQQCAATMFVHELFVHNYNPLVMLFREPAVGKFTNAHAYCAK
jgi:hypothetical protein